MNERRKSYERRATGNSYADLLEHTLERTPKDVMAAVAVDALMELGYINSEVMDEVRKRWLKLHNAHIVPQRPKVMK